LLSSDEIELFFYGVRLRAWVFRWVTRYDAGGGRSVYGHMKQTTSRNMKWMYPNPKARLELATMCEFHADRGDEDISTISSEFRERVMCNFWEFSPPLPSVQSEAVYFETGMPLFR
jgi:hypothetical protein